MPRDWARTGRRKNRGRKQIFFLHWRAQNPKPAKATLKCHAIANLTANLFTESSKLRYVSRNVGQR
jgi:hypothetical protein